MKKITFSALAFLVAAFFGMIQFGSPTALAATTASGQMGQNKQAQHVQLPSNQQGMNPYNKAEAFLGTVTKQNGHYVLTVGQITYKLTDQRKVAQYKGKQVEIIGKLNPKTNRIKVKTIKRPSF